MPFAPPSLVVRRLAALVAACACLLGLAWAAAQPAAARTQSLDLRVSVSLAPGSGAALKYRGTFTGAPLGRGKVSLVTRLGSGGDATVRYTMSTSRGSFSASADVKLSYHGSKVSYRGRATIAKGTGAYRSLRSNDLRIAGTAGLTADLVTLSLSGPISS
jgi:hypothetical protein